MITVNDLVLRMSGPVLVCLDEKHLKRVLKKYRFWGILSYLFTLSVGLEWDFVICILEQIPLVNPTCTSIGIKDLDGF